MSRLSTVLAFYLFLPIGLPATEGGTSISDEDITGILQYVYYWHLDHAEIARLQSNASLDVHFSSMDIQRVPGDNTEFFLLVIPALDIEITLKQADYDINEIGAEIKHAKPKIAAIHRNAALPDSGSPHRVRSYATKDLLAHFHERRHQRAPADTAILEHLRKALEALVEQEAHGASEDAQSFHVGPISIYSNDLWIVWVEQKKLLLFSSDLDIRTAAYWDHLPLHTRIFDLDGGVVTSLSEAPGRNAYVTKSWAGRILYNTLIDGYPIRLTPAGR